MTYAAYQGETVRLTGGREIPAQAFGAVRAANALRRILPESRPHVLEVDLRALGITDFGTHRQYTDPRHARWQNNGVRIRLGTVPMPTSWRRIATDW